MFHLAKQSNTINISDVKTGQAFLLNGEIRVKIENPEKIEEFHSDKGILSVSIESWKLAMIPEGTLVEMVIISATTKVESYK